MLQNLVLAKISGGDKNVVADGAYPVLGTFCPVLVVAVNDHASLAPRPVCHRAVYKLNRPLGQLNNRPTYPKLKSLH